MGHHRQMRDAIFGLGYVEPDTVLLEECLNNFRMNCPSDIQKLMLYCILGSPWHRRAESEGQVCGSALNAPNPACLVE